MMTILLRHFKDNTKFFNILETWYLAITSLLSNEVKFDVRNGTDYVGENIHVSWKTSKFSKMDYECVKLVFEALTSPKTSTLRTL